MWNDEGHRARLLAGDLPRLCGAHIWVERLVVAALKKSNEQRTHSQIERERVNWGMKRNSKGSNNDVL